VTSILEIKDDAKLRRQFVQTIVEEVLVKKPFVKVFAMGLLTESSLVRSEPLFDLP